MKAITKLFLLALIGLISFNPALMAQRRVNLRNSYERLLCVVPMVGAGTYADPRRPAYVPVPGAAPSRQGIIAFSYQLSDDGQFALVEFVATRRSAFRAILADPGVTAFEKGRARRADIEAEFRRFRSTFNLDSLGVSLP